MAHLAPLPTPLARAVDWFAARSLPMQLLMAFGLAIAIERPLWDAGSLLWYAPGGARVLLLVLLPVRLWPALLLGEFCWRWMLEVEYGTGLLHRALSVFPQPVGSALAIAWLRRRWTPERVEVPAGMIRLLLALLLSGALNTATNTVFIVTVYPNIAESNLLNFMFTAMVGAIDAPLVFTATALALLLRPAGFRLHRRQLLDLALGAAYVALIAVLARTTTAEGGLRGDYASILLPLPILYLSFRYGWRGAALALALLAPALLLGQVAYTGTPGATAQNMLLLTLTGAAGLLMGSAIDALRSSREALSARSLDLDAMNRELGELSVQLRQAARRNLELEEAQLKRIAGELHDELGQSLTAIQTRLKLVEGRLQEAGMSDTTVAMQDIITGMRRTVRGLMDSLRPAALDQFGLVHAIREGPIAELLEGAGLDFRFRVIDPHGAIDRLDDDTANAIYRIVQEAATNTVRHARATRFVARVRLGHRSGRALVFLDLRDDGVGLPETIRQGARGLQGIRDRVTALGGNLSVARLHRGTRLHAMLPS